jgi:hypothetical protein
MVQANQIVGKDQLGVVSRRGKLAQDLGSQRAFGQIRDWIS